MASVHLIEISAWDADQASEVVLRFTDMPDPAATTLNGVAWAPGADIGPVSAGVLEVSGSFGPSAGLVKIASVSLDLEEPRASAVTRLVLVGRPVTIRRGAWRADYASYQTVYSGEITAAPYQINEGGGTRLTLSLSALGDFLDVPLLAATYQGTGGTEGPVGLAGTLKPAVFGAARNVAPVLVNNAQLVYQLHGYGAIVSVDELFQRGVSMGAPAGDYADYAALIAAQLTDGSYATCLAEGLVRLGAAVQEPLTADVTGDVAGGRTAASIIKRMTVIAGIDPTKIDDASFTAFDAAEPATVSWAEADDKSVGEVATALLKSFFAYWTVSGAGQMQLGRIRDGGPRLTPPGPRVTLARIAGGNRPLYERRLGYQPVWRVQRSGEYNEPVPGVEDAIAIARAQALVLYDLGFETDPLASPWSYGEGWEREADPALTINGTYAAVHDMARVLTAEPGVTIAGLSPAGTVGEDEYEFFSRTPIAIDAQRKVPMRSRCVGAAGADGKIALRVIWVDGSTEVLRKDDSVPVAISEATVNLTGIFTPPATATHFHLAFVRSESTTGRVGVDRTDFTMSLTEADQDALLMLNGAEDPGAQANRRTFGLKAGVDDTGAVAASKVSLVGFDLTEGSIVEHFDATRIHIPVGPGYVTPRGGAQGSAEATGAPDGSYYVGFDTTKTGLFAGRDMALLQKTGGDVYWWDSTGAQWNLVLANIGAVVALGHVLVTTGSAVVDADYFDAGQSIATLGEVGSSRLNFRGPWSSVSEYRFGDTVSHFGSSYRYTATSPSTDIEPPNATYWEILVEAPVLLSLGFTAQAFTFDAQGAAAPAGQSISFSATLENSGASIVWDAQGYDANDQPLGAIALTGSGSLRGMTVAAFGAAAYAVVSVTAGLVSDQIKVVRLQDGEAGADALVGYLTNEAHTLAADAAGTVADFSGAAGSFKVFEGTNDISDDARVVYSKPAGSTAGLTGSINADTGAYSVTGLSPDEGTLMLRATVDGNKHIDKTFTVTKSRAGDEGPPGVAGATWYDGTGAPASALGAVNDYYLDTATGDVYKKTGASSWALDGNIAGDNGDKWFSGSGAPGAGLGVDGDRYLDKATGDVYLKTAGIWSIDTNIKGDPGANGADAATYVGEIGLDAETGGTNMPAYISFYGLKDGVPDKAEAARFLLPDGSYFSWGGNIPSANNDENAAALVNTSVSDGHFYLVLDASGARRFAHSSVQTDAHVAFARKANDGSWQYQNRGVGWSAWPASDLSDFFVIGTAQKQTASPWNILSFTPIQLTLDAAPQLGAVRDSDSEQIIQNAVSKPVLAYTGTDVVLLNALTVYTVLTKTVTKDRDDSYLDIFVTAEIQNATSAVLQATFFLYRDSVLLETFGSQCIGGGSAVPPWVGQDTASFPADEELLAAGTYTFELRVMRTGGGAGNVVDQASMKFTEVKR